MHRAHLVLAALVLSGCGQLEVRLPGAVLMPRGVLERDAEAAFPDPDTPLVLYCGGGYRSALAAQSLGQMGYTTVASMDGGWRAWTEAGYETEGGA